MRLIIAIGLLVVASDWIRADDIPTAHQDRLTVLTLNVGIFPKEVKGFISPQESDKKRQRIADESKRAGELADALIQWNGRPDVILLQEIWSTRARDVLIERLSESFPYHHHPPTDSNSALKMMPAGLMIFSQHPLSGTRFKEFTRGFGADKAARKGVLGAVVTKGQHRVAVITTHLQAGGKRDPTVKPDQLRECNELVQQLRGSDPELIAVLAGDFNIRSTVPEAYTGMLAQLPGAKDTFEADQNELAGTTRNPKHPNKRIDYILTFGDVTATSKIIDPAGNRISDHLAVFATIELK